MGNDISSYVPQTFYKDGQLSIPGTTSTGDAKSTADAVATGIQSFVATLPPADASMFMAAVNATNPTTFAPGGKVAPDLSTRLEKIETGLKAFESMLVSTNDFDELARVMIEQYGQQRHEAVADRQQMRQMAQQELQASAGQLQKEASDMMSGAITSLVLSCVSAAVSIGMSAVAMGGQLKSLKDEMSATEKLGGIEGELAGRLEGTGSKAGGEAEGLAETPEAPAMPKASPEVAPPKVADEKAPVLSTSEGSGNDNAIPEGAGNKGPSKGEVEQENAFSDTTTKQLHEMKAQANIALKQAESANVKFQFMGQVGGTLGHLGEAGANAAGTMAQAQAKNDEAQGKLDEAQAENLNAQADLKKAMVDSVDDMIKQLIAAVKDLQEAKAERMRSFSRI